MARVVPEELLRSLQIGGLTEPRPECMVKHLAVVDHDTEDRSVSSLGNLYRGHFGHFRIAKPSRDPESTKSLPDEIREMSGKVSD